MTTPFSRWPTVSDTTVIAVCAMRVASVLSAMRAMTATVTATVGAVNATVGAVSVTVGAMSVTMGFTVSAMSAKY